MSEQPAWLEQARKHMNLTAYLAGIGGEIVDIWPLARARLPYSEKLVGDPATGVVHGGVITGLLDHTSGIAVMAKLREPMPIATLDLRIDYMRPAKPHVEIVAECECVRVTHEVAFVRGTAHQGDASDPIALCTGAFMLIRGGVSAFPASP
ncbi:MAG TPA: PaaI family thioesterase [Rhizomicrobium sp.]